MKKLFILMVSVLTLLLGLGLAKAEEKKVPGFVPVVWSLDTQFRTEYLGGIGQVFYDKPIWVNDISVSYGDWFAGTWISTALGGDAYGSTFGDEVDLYAGWGHTYDWLRLQVSASYFMICELDDLGNDLWVVDGEASFPKVRFVQPYVAMRSFNQVSSRSPQRGWYGWAGLRRTQPTGLHFHGDELKLKLDLKAGYSDGVLGRDPGPVFGRITSALPFKLSDHATLTPSLVWQVPIGSQAKTARPHTKEHEVVGALSLNFKF